MPATDQAHHASPKVPVFMEDGTLVYVDDMPVDVEESEVAGAPVGWRWGEFAVARSLDPRFIIETRDQLRRRAINRAKYEKVGLIEIAWFERAIGGEYQIHCFARPIG